jgi:hypothetical protein
MTIRRNVIFQSTAFNTTESKDYFINECCFGDDLARWLIEQLNARGIRTEPEPGQEDFGWWLTFRVGATDYDFVLGSRRGNNDKHEWMGWIERSRGFVGSLFGARKRGIKADAVEVIHAILSVSPKISDVRWFSNEDFNKEENGQMTPIAD